MRHLKWKDGRRLPLVGQGTWEMGVERKRRDAEVGALRLGFDLGMTLVDTAEMYASGGAEEVVGIALEGRRDSIFVVSKVLPENASRAGTIRACERSLKRLRTDRLDLYLLHWESSFPITETVAAFVELERAGKILAYGVSNLSMKQLEEARAAPGGKKISADQVLYNLGRRGIERKLLPECRARKILVMAYSPYEQGKLEIGPRGDRKKRDALAAVARRHGVTPAQVALAWTIRGPGVLAIPKSSEPQHVRENAAAADLTLTSQDLEDLDRAFPAPREDVELETL